MKFPKFFVGPMSLEVVDFLVTSKHDIGFIPSRRQVDFSGGYVNCWTTESFCKYVREKNSKILLERDHGGPEQGTFDDDGINSFLVDSNNFDIIHVDVWKKYKDVKIATEKTIETIQFLSLRNPELKFEVGTEESICRLEPEDLKYLLGELSKNLSRKTFENIVYVVVQCGTKLQSHNNLGVFDEGRLVYFINVCKSFGKLSKEHNGDYISNVLRKRKFELGLDSINIAPEIGTIQTKILLENIDEKDFENFYRICYNSGRWNKWVDSNFIPEENKKELVTICGHYVFSTPLVKRMIETHKEKIINSFENFFENLFEDSY